MNTSFTARRWPSADPASSRPPIEQPKKKHHGSRAKLPRTHRCFRSNLALVLHEESKECASQHSRLLNLSVFFRCSSQQPDARENCVQGRGLFMIPKRDLVLENFSYLSFLVRTSKSTKNRKVHLSKIPCSWAMFISSSPLNKKLFIAGPPPYAHSFEVLR